MDSWFKAKAEALAQAAQQHVAVLDDVLQASRVDQKATSAPGIKELKFGQGPIGFEIEYLHVIRVEEGRQAARLGVEIGDHLVKVDGKQLPEFEPGDDDAMRDADNLAMKWMREMPLPAILTFEVPTSPVGSEDGASGDEAEEEGDARASVFAIDDDDDDGHPSSSPRHAEDEVGSSALAGALDDCGGDNATVAEIADATHAADASSGAGASPRIATEESVSTSVFTSAEPSLADSVIATTTAPTVLATTAASATNVSVTGLADAYREAETELSDVEDSTRAGADGVGVGAFAGEVAVADTVVRARSPEPEADGVKAQATFHDFADLQRELQHEKEARWQLSVDLQEARRLRSEVAATLEAERKQSAIQQKKISELKKQLAASKSQNREILLGQSQAEAESFDALEEAKAREAKLQEELVRSREAVEVGAQFAVDAAKQRAVAAESQVAELQASVADLTVQIQELTAKKVDAEGKMAAADLKVETIQKQFGGFSAAHEAEIELVREEQALQERLHRGKLVDMERRLLDQKDKSAKDVDLARQEAEAARAEAAKHKAAAQIAAAEAEAAAVECAAARRAAAEADVRLGAEDSDGVLLAAGTEEWAPPVSRSPGASEEVSMLYNRIDALERRCVTLQKKLNARPVVSSHSSSFDMEAGGLQRRPAWADRVTSVAGPRAGELAVICYTVPRTALRFFLEQLLKRDIWLVAFFVHLLVLYTIAASCYAQSALDPSIPTANIDEVIDRAAERAAHHGTMTAAAETAGR
eukprot:TRINITY_DN74647_c0_g1_i1.p1 TRINITY_DN74647_c0_g1~~TRINITY_DN74647_c0_g1_i1.p1  ORF type:complete len:777 (-),score=214.89 TRINITY_DN74647_c0_g1_i1:41-2329(-)